jgi:LPXTG-motif cell wall-anchored protein
MAGPVNPALASTSETIAISIDCTVTGPILITADPGDLLVFHFLPFPNEPLLCANGTSGGNFWLEDYNSTEDLRTTAGYLGELGSYVEGIWTDFNPSVEELGSWWQIYSDQTMAAELRTLGANTYDGGSVLPATQPLVAGESVIGVIEGDGFTLHNSIIWAGPRTLPAIDPIVDPAVDPATLALTGAEDSATALTFAGGALVLLVTGTVLVLRRRRATVAAERA